MKGCGGKCTDKPKVVVRKNTTGHVSHLPKKVPIICDGAKTRDARANRNN